MRVMNCPICKSLQLEFIYKLESAPMQNKLYETPEEALRETKVKITLYGCRNCSFVFNADFHPKKVNYSSDYDNTQECSGYFSKYIENLAKRLIRKYALKSKKVLEIGCGKGGFLERLYKNGVRNIKGFDPSYVEHDPEIDKLVVKKYFSPKYFNKNKVDFIICRHVLEHVPNPSEFVSSVISCLSDDGLMYFEFPSLEWIIKHKAFFDFYYEHCNYFTKNSVMYLFGQFGFSNITFNYGLDGQYFQLEIGKNRGGNNLKISRSRKDNNSNINFDEISEFLDKQIREWKGIIEGLDSFAVWGAGAKGVTFLNRLNISRKKCKYVIDINPKKQNKFVSITCQKIVSPEILRKEKIKTIIIMNPAYEKEIRDCAKKYGFEGNFIVL